MAPYEKHTYERCSCERHAYEMAYGRCTPMRDKPMRWPVGVAEMILDEKEQKRRYGAVLYPKGDSANGVLAEIAEAAEQRLSRFTVGYRDFFPKTKIENLKASTHTTPMRCTSMGCTPSEVHAHEAHASEVHVQ
jgi:hypothetical protein